MDTVKKTKISGSIEQESLVKYGTPFEVSPTETIFTPEMYLAQLPQEQRTHGKRIQGCYFTSDQLVDLSTPSADNDDWEKKDSKTERIAGKWVDHSKILQRIICDRVNLDGSITREDLQTVLNMILPPKEWMVEQRKWRQLASSMPATKMDVIKLEEKLDMHLKHEGARETGMCPIRGKLYGEVFDELIRHVAITCVEQGMLLVRIRNEIRDTIREYENIFASSTSCAIRKTLCAETRKASMESKIENTLAKIEKKKACLAQLQRIYAGLDEKNVMAFQEIRAKHGRQVTALKESNQALKTKLEGIILPKRGGGGG